MSSLAKQLKLNGIYAVLLMGILNSVGQALVFELGKGIHVLWIIGIQSMIGFLLVLLVSARDGRISELSQVWKVPRSSWIMLHARSLICIVGGLGLIYHSYQYLPLSTASWFMAIPLATIWAYLLLKEGITKKECLALIIGCIGLLLISSQNESRALQSDYRGYIYISLGIVVFSLGWVLSRKLIQAFGERNFNTLSNAIIGLYGIVIALICIDPPLLDTKSFALLTLRGVILGLVSILFSRTIKCFKITKGLILARLENVYTVIIGVSVFGEHFSLLAFTGAALVLGSSFLASKS